MTTIAKNNSGLTQKFLSIVLEDGSEISLSDKYSPYEISVDSDLQSLISSGDIVINDGSQDLSPSEADAMIQGGNPEIVSQAEAEAGTSQIVRSWTAERVKQAVQGADFEAVFLTSWDDYKNNTPFDNTKVYVHEGEITATDATSIDLNGALLTGMHSREYDKLISSEAAHTLFSSSKSGTIENLFIKNNGSSSKTFNITGGTGFETYVLKDCSLNTNTSVGSFDNLFAVQIINTVFQSNAGGLTVNDIGTFSHKDSSWIQNNTAPTYITLTGGYTNILFQGAGIGVPPTKTGLNLSGIGTISGRGQIQGGFIFSGSGTYVDDVTIFEQVEWTVDAIGIDQIYKDNYCFGNVIKDGQTNTIISSTGVPVKITGSSTLGETFRMDDDGGTDNRIKNTGLSKLPFQITGAISVDTAGFGFSSDRVSVYVAIDGVVDTASRSIGDVGGFDGGILAIPLNHTFFLEPNSYAEVWVANDADTSNLIIPSYNYTVKV